MTAGLSSVIYSCRGQFDPTETQMLPSRHHLTLIDLMAAVGALPSSTSRLTPTEV